MDKEINDGCTNHANHTEGPVGYVEWSSWADKMLKTHNQEQCPECLLYVIWVEKI